jgi:hypothetical protein
MSLRIGVDFDNTLISYDRLLRDLAARRGWVPRDFPASKDALRTALVRQDGHDQRWQRLQADAYGTHIRRARPSPGFAAWLRGALRAGHEVFVVSHKSATSHLDPSVRLRDAARTWLRAQGLLSDGRRGPPRLRPENVVFTDTRDEKVAAIARLDLDAFVDDLLGVLEHPAFPAATQRLHFGGGSTRYGPAATWPDVARRLATLAAIGPDAAAAITATMGRTPVRAGALPGGNNRLLEVTLDDGRKVLLKRYLLDPRDPRDRAGAEAVALETARRARLGRVPRLLYKDPRGAFVLLSFLEGRPMRGMATRDQVLQAVRFASRMARLPRRGVPEAADSRRCLGDYVSHIERRLDRISAGLRRPDVAEEVRRFVRGELRPLRQSLVRRFRAQVRAQGLSLEAPLPPGQRILSASDFGFHNAVLSPAGRVQFVDFEYFGVDDPAKLAADFTHHVGQRLGVGLRALFVHELAKALPDPEVFLRRFELVRPLVGLEWVLIVLNVLAPAQMDRLRFSHPEAASRALVERRLRLARQLLRRLA